MNLVNILDHIEKVDTDVNDQSNTRRAAMKNILSFSKKVAAAAVPLGLGSMFNTASAQTASDAVVASLQVVLAIKHFELALITNGLAKISFTGTDLAAFNQIKDQETKHIAFLQAAITAAGKTPVAAKTTYDFTGGGTNFDINVSKKTFTKVVQIVKDATIRTIKGQAPTLVKQGDYLAAALAIHSVDARASSRLRVMRLANGFSPTNRPWVNNVDETEVAGSLQLDINIFVGEGNVQQGSSTVTNINGQAVTQAQATQAFDEPFTLAQAQTAFAPFKVTF